MIKWEALAHFLKGDGTSLSIGLYDVGLDLSAMNLPAVRDLINSGFEGTVNIDERFNRNTFDDSFDIGLYLGNISLKTSGRLTVKPNGDWNYDGVVRAYDDLYDGNKGTWRGPAAEAATKLLDALPGNSFTIKMPGQVNVNESGKKN